MDSGTRSGWDANTSNVEWCEAVTHLYALHPCCAELVNTVTNVCAFSSAMVGLRRARSGLPASVVFTELALAVMASERLTLHGITRRQCSTNVLLPLWPVAGLCKYCHCHGLSRATSPSRTRLIPGTRAGTILTYVIMIKHAQRGQNPQPPPALAALCPVLPRRSHLLSADSLLIAIKHLPHCREASCACARDNTPSMTQTRLGCPTA